MANFTVIVNEYLNLPASEVGDGTGSTQYGVAIVFTRAMFTTNTVPPYADPEGDAALNLKITSLPLAGLLKFNSVNCTINQIVSFADIDSGLFTYVPDNGNVDAYSTNFTFSIADAGNGTFVA
jgi:hypothetical protein